MITWNCWLEKQRHGQQEPWILMVDAPSALHTSRRGVNMLHLKIQSTNTHNNFAQLFNLADKLSRASHAGVAQP